MSLLFSPTLPLLNPHHSPSSGRSQTRLLRASASSRLEKKPKRKKKQRQERKGSELVVPVVPVSAAEKSLRFAFMEELMVRSRKRDARGVSDVIYDMVAAGLNPGPRSFHGLVVAHCLAGDPEGAMQSLRRELSAGLRPLHETFIALIRLFGSKGQTTRGLEILAAMEKLNYDIRQAWHILVEELVENNHLLDANEVFLKGADGGLRASDELYDRMIVQDCKVGDHSNALEIAYAMEAAGRMATTFHFNCLLSCQATCGIPEIAMETFENMEYSGEDFMKPDTETYNWVIQAFTRAESYDRVPDVTELLGMMVEDHKRLQPNVRTYALLVECFTKYCMIREAIRHFRALRKFDGGIKVLYNEGNHGDPLSLYLRALCREGRVVDLLEALEAMVDDNQPIPARAMILSKKYRTLVSSWIEPLQEEAEHGYQIDYIERYVAEGGLTGERKRWVPRRGKASLDPDALGYAYNNPIETSFKQRCLNDWKTHHRNLLKMLLNEGLAVLGDASEEDYLRVVEWLKKVVKGPDKNALKPKAASKMTVSQLKEELDAQGLPTDGTRTVLYQRVQKARRINRSRGRPLWVPPVVEKEEEVDEVLDELISCIKLHEGDTEFWRRRFLGEGKDRFYVESLDEGQSDVSDDFDDVDAVEDAQLETADEEPDEGGEAEVEHEVDPTDSEDIDNVVKAKESEAKKPLQMIGVQLLKNSGLTTRSSKKSRRRARLVVEDELSGDWFPLDIFDAFKELQERKFFDVDDDMYTLADAWGWTWEREIKKRTPQKWSQEWEVDLAIKLMQKVIELGGTPTIGDCAMILRAAIRGPVPSAFLKILQTTHSLGYVFGSPLYNEVISLCLDLSELDAAIAIVADMETNGVTVPYQTLDRVISAKQIGDGSVDEKSKS